MTDQTELTCIAFDEILDWHLSWNFYPSLSHLDRAKVKQVISACVEEDYDRLVEINPNHQATAGHLCEWLRLDWFVDEALECPEVLE